MIFITFATHKLYIMQKIMDWSRLINDKRFGLEHYHDPKKATYEPISDATTTA